MPIKGPLLQYEITCVVPLPDGPRTVSGVFPGRNPDDVRWEDVFREFCDRYGADLRFPPHDLKFIGARVVKDATW